MQFLEAIAVAGRRQGFFLKAVQEVEGIWGGWGTVFELLSLWSCFLMDRENCSAACCRHTRQLWEISFPLGGTGSYFGKGRNKLPFLRSKGFLEDFQFNKPLLWSCPFVVQAILSIPWCVKLVLQLFGVICISFSRWAWKSVLVFITPMWALTVWGQRVGFFLKNQELLTVFCNMLCVIQKSAFCRLEMFGELPEKSFVFICNNILIFLSHYWLLWFCVASVVL